jgi:putative tryptophan/tyrosine transport system substrate-binding protein
MRRRDFIKGIARSAVAWPLAAHAQQQPLSVVGFLHSASPEPNAALVKMFRKGLFEAGFNEGQNVTIEYRWADNQSDRLALDAADLVRRDVKVIATPASTPAALAAKAATTTIPIVFASGADPVAVGLVGSLNHPGGNVTGIGFETVEITGKAFEVLHELLPKEMHITLLMYPNSVFSAPVKNKIQASAAALDVRFDVLEAGSDSEIEGAFAKVGQQSGAPIMLGPDAFYTSRRAQIVSFAAHYAVPVMYIAREFTQAGGLICYGPDLANAYRETGTYTGRILKGEKPGDLPVVLPTKFDMVINLRTAKSLGIVVPDRLLALADEVIE